MFPDGEEGWSFELMESNQMTPMEYYRYRLQIRLTENKLHIMGRLFQQYIVDVWTIVEQTRLSYIRNRQHEFRTELYNGLMDALENNRDVSNIGRRIILPSSFTNGPRYMTKKFQDAMAIVSKYGKPDVFLTMTCNARWSEIQNKLLPGQSAYDRPDLCARVFSEKFKILKDHVLKKHVLGKVVAYVYVIEFQKRGLPHCHMLLILANEDKIRSTEEYDSIVSAEIPNSSIHPQAYETVTKCMIHGPCGPINPDSPCMIIKDGQKICSKGYPKQFINQTNTNVNGYPLYRRRNLNSFMKNQQLIDAQWVVPHNLYLCTLMDCHINVEICSSITSVKYLYKYVYKGHDKALIEISDRNDEIKMHIDSRYVSATEAFWRLHTDNGAFDLNSNNPTVYQLAIHLDGEQNITYNQNNVRIENINRNTTLTAWMLYNSTHEDGLQILYSDFPEHYTYSSKEGWKPRKKGQTIGRIYTVSPAQKEKFYLRLMLFHKPGAKNFADLRTVNGEVFPTYALAAERLGLLENDSEWERALSEACNYQHPKRLRELFCVILVFCNPTNPKYLWERFKDELISDILRNNNGMEEQAAINLCLIEIDNYLSYNSLSLKNDFPDFPQINISLPQTISQTRIPRLFRDEQLTSNDRIFWENYVREKYRTLNPQQKTAYDTIIRAIDTPVGNCTSFYLDGPGGSGKTYLYQLILAKVRTEGHFALAVASSGIAALLLPQGRTAHSRFGIPLIINETSISNIKCDSTKAELIRLAKVIVWDEAPMLRKEVFDCVDRLLKDIMKTVRRSNENKLFGGKVFVFGGDFRQILPVIRKGSERDIIDHSLKLSNIWPQLEKFQLTTNMRLRSGVHSNHLSPAVNEFSEYLLRIGEGREENQDRIISLPDDICLPLDSFNSFISQIIDQNQLEIWTILATKNDVVDEINSLIMSKITEESQTFISADSVVENESAHLYPIEFLNTLNISGIPPHRLTLKRNCRVILMRNINPSIGLCNGTRLKIINLNRRVITADICSGAFKDRRVLIPRINLTTVDSGLPFTLKRRQFPLRPSYAMTINKSQGQTLTNVAIYLKENVFTHGQLYVAMSRVKSKSNLKIFTHKLNDRFVTKNIVFSEIFNH